MLSPKPLTASARVVAAILAAVCVVAGVLGIVLAVRQSQVLLLLAGAAAIALGLLYGRAAWLGRPLHFPRS